MDERFFKPDDFHVYVKDYPKEHWGIDPCSPAERLARVANAKLSKALGPVVYSGANIFPAEHVWNVHQDKNMHTHQARLFNVREIEPEKPDTAESLLRELVREGRDFGQLKAFDDFLERARKLLGEVE